MGIGVIGRPSFCRFVTSVVVSGSLLLIATPAAKAQVVITPGPGNSFDAQDQDQYHAQVVNNWCAIASMEMELDEPMVTGANAFVGNLIGQGDTVRKPTFTTSSMRRRFGLQSGNQQCQSSSRIE